MELEPESLTQLGGNICPVKVCKESSLFYKKTPVFTLVPDPSNAGDHCSKSWSKLSFQSFFLLADQSFTSSWC